MTEEELAQVQAELATAKALVQSKDEEIESLKKSVRGGNDLAKKTKELEKEKSTAETSVTDLHERLEKVEASEKAATEKAEKAHEAMFTGLLKSTNLDDEQLKVVEHHYKNTLSSEDDSTFEGMSTRLSHSLAIAGVNNSSVNPILSVSSFVGAPVIENRPSLTADEHEVAKRFGMKPEEYAKYRDQPVSIE